MKRLLEGAKRGHFEEPGVYIQSARQTSLIFLHFYLQRFIFCPRRCYLPASSTKKKNKNGTKHTHPFQLTVELCLEVMVNSN